MVTVPDHGTAYLAAEGFVGDLAQELGGVEWRCDRLLVAAHYLDGVRYEDLAEALALPLGTVKTQLHRAKQQLRRMLETDLR